MVNNLLCYDYKDKYNIPIDRLFLIFFSTPLPFFIYKWLSLHSICANRDGAGQYRFINNHDKNLH